MREDACGKTGDEDGGEKRRNVEASKPGACGGVSAVVFVGDGVLRKCSPQRTPIQGVSQDVEQGSRPSGYPLDLPQSYLDHGREPVANQYGTI